MNLYRRRSVQASAVVLLACLIASVTIAQRRKPHKLRATAILELTTDQVGTITARLVPVTILDEGTFHDASAYRATPRPMALDNGVVYEAQKSGEVAGYVTIVGAAKDPAWRALGKWQAASPPASTKPAAAGSATPASSGGSGGDRPVIRRGDTSPSAPVSQASPSPAPSASPTPQTSSVPISSGDPDDPNRPVLRRRTPEATPAKPGTTPAPSAAATPEGTVPATKPAIPVPGVQTMVAVSDTETSDSRSFQFQWKKGEQAEMEAKMRRLALAQLPRENAQLTEHSLTNVSIRAFDLDLSNDAVMVLSAEIPASYVATGGKNAPAAPARFVSRYITLIARVNLEGNPQRLAVSITDSSRLDVAPRLELIDAVDVDGDGYGELLFRRYGFDEKSYIIYGIGRSTVTKVFEGAAEPLTK